MRKILLDTNFLLIPQMFRVDIFEEIRRICDFNYELCVLKQTIDELNKIIKEDKPKHQLAARIGLGLIKAKDLKIVSQKEGYTDDVIVRLAKEDYIIATQDKELKNRLNLINAEYITLRQMKYLIFMNKKKVI
ncbi:MAG: PIN domain-containing protein [Candidatus Woesearchaeota archaeon]